MPKLKHLAICTNDIEASRRFYESAFEMRTVRQGDVVGCDYLFMTDGDFHVSLLNFTNDEVARAFFVDGGSSYVGIHHFGFVDPDPEALVARLKGEGVTVLLDSPEALLQTLDRLKGQGVIPHDDPRDEAGMNFEYKVRDPNGIVVDIGETWLGHGGDASA